MAKLSTIAKEKVKAKLATFNFKRRKELSAKSKDISISLEERMEAGRKLRRMRRNTSASRVTRRCRQCGRPHSVYRKFGLCRIHLRELLMNGEVAGGRKSSW